MRIKLQLIITFLAFTLAACGQQNDSSELTGLRNYTASLIETTSENNLISTDVTNVVDIEWSLVNSDESSLPLMNGYDSPEEALERTNNNLDALKMVVTKTDGIQHSYTYRWNDLRTMHAQQEDRENQIMISMEDMERNLSPTSEIKILRLFQEGDRVTGYIQTIQGIQAASLINSFKKNEDQQLINSLSGIDQKEATFLLKFEGTPLDDSENDTLFHTVTTLFERRDGRLTLKPIEDRFFDTQSSLLSPNNDLFSNK